MIYQHKFTEQSLKILKLHGNILRTIEEELYVLKRLTEPTYDFYVLPFDRNIEINFRNTMILISITAKKLSTGRTVKQSIPESYYSYFKCVRISDANIVIEIENDFEESIITLFKIFHILEILPKVKTVNLLKQIEER